MLTRDVPPDPRGASHHAVGGRTSRRGDGEEAAHAETEARNEEEVGRQVKTRRKK